MHRVVKISPWHLQPSCIAQFAIRFLKVIRQLRFSGREAQPFLTMFRFPCICISLSKLRYTHDLLQTCCRKFISLLRRPGSLHNPAVLFAAAWEKNSLSTKEEEGEEGR